MRISVQFSGGGDGYDFVDFLQTKVYYTIPENKESSKGRIKQTRTTIL
jgi:hypothetical protein